MDHHDEKIKSKQKWDKKNLGRKKIGLKKNLGRKKQAEKNLGRKIWAEKFGRKYFHR